MTERRSPPPEPPADPSPTELGPLVWRISPVGDSPDYYAAGYEGNWYPSQIEAEGAIDEIRKSEAWASALEWRVHALRWDSLSADDRDFAWLCLAGDQADSLAE